MRFEFIPWCSSVVWNYTQPTSIVFYIINITPTNAAVCIMPGLFYIRSIKRYRDIDPVKCSVEKGKIYKNENLRVYFWESGKNLVLRARVEKKNILKAFVLHIFFNGFLQKFVLIVKLGKLFSKRNKSWCRELTEFLIMFFFFFFIYTHGSLVRRLMDMFMMDEGLPFGKSNGHLYDGYDSFYILKDINEGNLQIRWNIFTVRPTFLSKQIVLFVGNLWIMSC